MSDSVKKITSRKRVNSGQVDSRALILSTTEKLMLDEGYGAVTTRRVAKEAGMGPSLVHYYFPTTDDLFIALFHQVIEETIEKQDDALHKEKPLKGLWDAYRNKNRTALAMEFMALGNHRKAVKQEIAKYTERTRKRRAAALSEIIDMQALEKAGCSPAAFSVLLVSVARTLVMEEGLGISCGHKDAKAVVEGFLEYLELTERVTKTHSR